MSKKTVYLLLGAVLVISAAAEALGVHLHVPAWYPLPFGYTSLFGFAGCLLRMVPSTMILMTLLWRAVACSERGGQND